MDVHFEDGPGYLLARTIGAFALPAMLATFEKIAAEARARGVRRVLIDSASMSGEIPELDRYDLGKRAAETFAHVERLAVLRSTGIRYTGFAFDVAQNRGLDARAFVDRAEAERWLLSD